MPSKLKELALAKADLNKLPSLYLQKIHALSPNSGNQEYTMEYQNALLNTETKLNVTDIGVSVNSQANLFEYLIVNPLYRFLMYEAKIY